MNKKKIGKALLSVVFAVAFFCLGLVSSFFLTSKEERKAQWIKRTIEENYYEEITPDDVYSVIGSELLDPYSAYYNETAYAELLATRQGSRSGFGFSYYSDNVIADVILNSPAYHAGLKRGMQFLSVTKGEQTISMEEMELGNALDTLDCQEGELVVFGTDHGDFSCVRSEYTQSYTEYKTAAKGYAFTGNAKLTLTETEGLPSLPANTAYIRLTDFFGTVSSEFAILMDLFREDGMRHLILDLRGNGGGYLSDVQKIASYLVKEATENRPVVVRAKYKSGKVEETKAKGNYYSDYFSKNSQVYLLADEGSASASECLIGAMVDYGTISYDHILLATEDGNARSYGKGIMQNTFKYSDGSALKLTVATVHWPVSDTCIHGVGVTEANGCISFMKERKDIADQTLLNMIGYITDKLA